MRVRWTPKAAEDLERIAQRIRRDNPEAALRVARTIYNGVDSLRTFPRRGRIGRTPGTRELLFVPLPYIAVYQIANDQIIVARIRHAAQNWPA